MKSSSSRDLAMTGRIWYDEQYERYWRSRIAPGKRTVSQLGAFIMAFLGYKHEHGEP